MILYEFTYTSNVPELVEFSIAKFLCMESQEPWAGWAQYKWRIVDQYPIDDAYTRYEVEVYDE